jgi:uncharacterized delta-60 repeat protein
MKCYFLFPVFILFLLYTHGQDGTPDPGFNKKGWTNFYFSYTGEAAETEVASMAIQSDGKIVVAGKVMGGPDFQPYHFCLTRYNRDGTLDNSFGYNGIITEGPCSPAVGDACQFILNHVISVVIQNDGKIIVGADLWVPAYGLFCWGFARFNSNGTLDITYGQNGKRISELTDVAELYSMAIQKDNKMVAVGRLGDGFTVLRYDETGTPDYSFGSGGQLTGTTTYTDMAIQGDGKIVVAGGDVLARYMTDGKLDSSFGNNGVVITGLDGHFVIQNDGKFVVQGGSAIARYTASGILDNSFGKYGKVNTDISFDFFYRFITMQSDGKIIIGGNRPILNDPTDFVSLRYTSSGKPDKSFGESGLVTHHFLTSDTSMTIASGVWNNGKLYVTGTMSILNNAATEGMLLAYKAGPITPDLPMITINNVSVNEGDSAKLEVNLDKAISSPVIVNYATKDGSAISKGRTPDYKTAKGTITIPENTLSATISIATIIDNITEEDESFSVNITLSRQMSAVAAISDSTGMATILSNSGLSSYTRTLAVNTETAMLYAKVMPNPSKNYFTLKFSSGFDKEITIKVFDTHGRLLESKTGISPGSGLRIGGNYGPGVYYAEIMQGVKTVICKLVKSSE